MPTATTASRRPAVRAPFRILAALICLIFAGAAVGMAYMTWKGGVQVLRVQDVVMIPGELWLARLMWLAALGRVRPPIGHEPPNVHWPFATPRVASIYWLIVICLSATR